MSCWTSSEIRPPKYRRVKTPTKLSQRGDDQQRGRTEPDRLVVGEDRVVDDVALDQRDHRGDDRGEQRAAERQDHGTRVPPAVRGQPIQPRVRAAAVVSPLVARPRPSCPHAWPRGGRAAAGAPARPWPGRACPARAAAGPDRRLGEQLIQPLGVDGVGPAHRVLPGLGQAQPDHPPVLGLGLPPQQPGRDEAVGRARSASAWPPPAARPAWPSAHRQRRPASGSGTAAASARHRPAPSNGTAAARSSPPVRRARLPSRPAALTRARPLDDH